jgi:hypothetical protein
MKVFKLHGPKAEGIVKLKYTEKGKNKIKYELTVH